MACMESKIKCDRQVPCTKCVSKGTECVYGSAMKKTPVSSPPTVPTAIASTGGPSRHANNTEPKISAPTQIFTSNTGPTSYPNQSCPGSSSQPNSPSDTSFTSSSSASARTPEPVYPTSTSGVVYVQDPEGYQQQTQPPGLPIESSIHPPAPIPPVHPDLSSVALYTGGYVPEPTVEAYSPSESDSTATEDQLVPVSSHLSPAYGSDVFTPFFTTIFPQTSPASTLTEVTLNIEELSMRGSSPEDFPFVRFLKDSAQTSVQSPVFAVEGAKADPYQTYEVDQGRLRAISPAPTCAELQHYCKSLTNHLPLTGDP